MIGTSPSCLPSSFLRTYRSHSSESNPQCPRFLGSGTAEQHSGSVWHRIRMRRDLTQARSSIEDGVQQDMKVSAKLFGSVGFAACMLVAQHSVAQDPAVSASKPLPPSSKADTQTRVTIEVTGGEKGAPVENASVYVKYIEERKLKKDKKLELNVKTNRDGLAHVPDAPLGRALVQVVAEGWKTYGRWLDITDPRQIIKVHLEKPPKWY